MLVKEAQVGRSKEERMNGYHRELEDLRREVTEIVIK